MSTTQNFDNTLEQLAIKLDLAMPATRMLLESMGLSAVQMDLGLRCDIHQMGVHVVTAFFIPEELVSELLRTEEYADTALGNLWDKLFSSIHFGNTPRKELYLYILADETSNSDELTYPQVNAIESSMSYSVKTVCSLKHLGLLLSNPFPLLAGASRANEAPALTLRRDQNDRKEGDSMPTRVLTLYNGRGATCAAELAKEPDGARAQLVGQLYGRIMGRGFKLFWSQGGLTLGHDQEAFGCALAHASRGENTAFELACFLAKASAEVTPGMSIGVHCVLANLDSLKMIAALDLLRHFMVATGASVEIESANSNVQNMAKLKFKFLTPAKVSQEMTV